MNKKHLAILLGIIVILSLTLAACGGGSSATKASTGDAATGKTTFASLPCVNCHGENAEGNIGPKLAGFSKGWDVFQTTVRNGRRQMPKFSTDVVSDQQLADVYAWLTSLK